MHLKISSESCWPLCSNLDRLEDLPSWYNKLSICMKKICGWWRSNDLFLSCYCGVTISKSPHNGQDAVSNHQPHDCLLNRLFGRRSKKTSKLRVIGLCVGNSSVTGEFPAQRASNAGNVPIWWCRHEMYPRRLERKIRVIHDHGNSFMP